MLGGQRLRRAGHREHLAAEQPGGRKPARSQISRNATTFLYTDKFLPHDLTVQVGEGVDLSLKLLIVLLRNESTKHLAQHMRIGIFRTQPFFEGVSNNLEIGRSLT